MFEYEGRRPMAPIARITEYLDIDVKRMMWCCNRCGSDLISADKNYKEACLVHVRDPREVHNPVVDGEYTFSPDPEWVKIVEFYCPSCGIMVENEYLPPGHPITHDIELDLDSLRNKHLNNG